MTDDDIHALIIDLIESHVDEEDRQLVLDWVMARKVAFDFMAEHGFMTPEDWANMGLKTTKWRPPLAGKFRAGQQRSPRESRMPLILAACANILRNEKRETPLVMRRRPIQGRAR